ncbi:MAG TPA: TonB-dependent receptor [Thermoanaerobaculia bacterium]|nr:TonB-dependent receptor [Thermoanaerobaculia bacterium]
MIRRVLPVLFSLVAATTLHAAQYRFAGRPLAEALRELQSRGLRLIYSDDVVTGDMVVKTEPRAAQPRKILDELLREHALRAEDGPRGSLVVIRDKVRDAHPPSRPAVQPAPPPMPVTIEEIVVTPSRFTILREEAESRQFLSREEVRRVPHLSDDLYRAIGRIPGTTSADVSARFNLRGGEEDEVLVLVDGAEIHDPFHVRDLYRAFSTIDAEAVGSVDVLSGGYPAEYGGRMSGVVDISTLSPTENKQELGVSLLNTRLLSQGTFAESRGSWLFSLRRGYLREVLTLVEDNSDINPRYYDLLGKVQWTLGERTVVSAHVMASRDRLTLHDGPGTTARAGYDDRYAWLNLRRSWTAALFTQSVLTWSTMGRDRKGTFDNEFDLQRGQLEDHHRSTSVTLKNDATLHLSPRQLLKFGATAKRVRARFDVEGSSVIPFAIFALGSPPREVRRSVHVRPGGTELDAWVADRVRVSDRIVAEAGLRAGSESYTPDGVHVSPRLNVGWTLSPHTSVRAAWGWFHQPQAIHELQVEDGVTEYREAQRAEHRVLGVEHSFRGGAEARLELYDKSLTHLRPRYTNLYDRLLVFPELRADRIRIAPESGHARGAELLVRSDAARPISGWLSYTFARVTDRIDGRDVPRDWDQPHAVTFSLNYQRGPQWNFNLAGTWHSGWPTTPVLARVEGTQLMTELGPRASTRLPDYQRLDFRASHTAGPFSFFVELFNLLGHENVTRVSTFEFQQDANGAVTASPVTESVIGILPSFGVTWRF